MKRKSSVKKKEKGSIAKRVYVFFKRNNRPYKNAKSVYLKWENIMRASPGSTHYTSGAVRKTFEIYNIKFFDNGGDGFSAKLNIPDGLDERRLEDVRAALESGFHGRLRYKIQNDDDGSWRRRVNVAMIVKRPIVYFKPLLLTNNKLLIGYDEFLKPITVDLAVEPHVLISGKTGSGKSFIVASILTNLLWNNRNNPENIELYFFQLAKSDFGAFVDCKGVVDICTTLRSTVKRLKLILKYADTVQKKINKYAFKDIYHWNSMYKDEPEYHLKSKYLIIEELPAFMPGKGDSKEVDSLKREFADTLTRIMQQCRAAGVHVIACVQKATKSSLSTDSKSQMARISLAQQSEIDSRAILDMGGAEKLKDREGIFKNSATFETFITATIDKDYKVLKQYVPEIKIPKKLTEKEMKDFMAFMAKIYDNLDVDEDVKEMMTNKKEEESATVEEATRKEFEKRKEQEVKPVEPKMTKEEVAKVKEEIAKEKESGFTRQRRDVEAIKFIQAYGGILNTQLSKIFFKYKEDGTQNSDFGSICSVRMKEVIANCPQEKLVMKKVKLREDSSSEPKGRDLIYYCREQDSTVKTKHNLFVIDFYISLIEELRKVDGKVIEFKTFCSLKESCEEIRPDAKVVYEFNGRKYLTYLEVEDKHYTGPEKMEVYERIREKQEFNLVMASAKGNLKIESKNIDIYQTDFNFSDFSEIFSIWLKNSHNLTLQNIQENNMENNSK